MKLKTYTDGGARGNPGPAAIGVLICSEDGEILLEHSDTIGEATNNVAEYRALIEGMRQAKELKAEELDCFLDSELVVKQLLGEYKLKNYNLQKLFDEVQKMKRQFQSTSFSHLGREEEYMRRADQLVNYALDEAKKKVRRGWQS
ncbi:MAG: ribonuclease HI family protein [Candidatus Omnitrophica bacterium]|nr:ribonuclease HI family protein [Candidatus Omnitrophota bacterium]